jgi:Protein of unknown function (DUF2934)
MSKAQRKAKNIKLVTPENQPSIASEERRAITKDDVAQRAYELFVARGRAEGHDVEDWLEAERQLEAESMAFSMLK